MIKIIKNKSFNKEVKKNISLLLYENLYKHCVYSDDVILDDDDDKNSLVDEDFFNSIADDIFNIISDRAQKNKINSLSDPDIKLFIEEKMNNAFEDIFNDNFTKIIDLDIFKKTITLIHNKIIENFIDYEKQKILKNISKNNQQNIIQKRL